MHYILAGSRTKHSPTSSRACSTKENQEVQKVSLRQKGKPRKCATKTQRMPAHGHLNSTPTNLQGSANYLMFSHTTLYTFKKTGCHII
jgi:hypothetical protein